MASFEGKNSGSTSGHSPGGPHSGHIQGPPNRTRLIVLLVAIVAVLLPVVGYTLYWIFPSASNVGYYPEQPIPYSHKLHAGQYKIPCLYCHSSAEKSVHAGVPPLNVCMNCHRVVKTDSVWIKKITAAYNEGRPIEWVRIHELPDHAHFNHKRHVAKGVACQTCHGPVQEMDRVYQYSALNMGWCLSCHRGFTTPKQILQKTYPGQKDPHGPVASINCTTCHY